MPDGSEITVDISIGGGSAPEWLKDVGRMPKDWLHQKNPYSDADTPEQAHPGPTNTYVLSYPMFHNISEPEGKGKGSEHAGPPATHNPSESNLIFVPESTPQTKEQIATIGSIVVDVLGHTPPKGEEPTKTEGESPRSDESPKLSPEGHPTARPEPHPSPYQEPKENDEEKPSPYKQEKEKEPDYAKELKPEYPDMLEAVWFAGFASSAGTKWSFWDGHHLYKGLNFGYDENDTNEKVSSLVGMYVNDALAISDWGMNDKWLAPESYSAHGRGSAVIDLSKNNQTGIASGTLPDDYKPKRDGKGPKHSPENALAAIAIISVSSDTDIGSIKLPPMWWNPVSNMHGSVMGLFCLGMVPQNALSLTFGAPKDISVSMIVLRNCPGSVVPKQQVLYSGTIKDVSKVGPIKMDITPILPAPWNPTMTSQRTVYVAPVDGKFATGT